jgi:hypothetical protein
MAFCSPHTVTQHPHDQEHNTHVRTLETRTLPHSAHERTVRVSLLRSNPSLALRVRLVCCIWCNQARWVQYPRDWFPESDSEPD